jgi:hypothetical protein
MVIRIDKDGNITTSFGFGFRDKDNEKNQKEELRREALRESLREPIREALRNYYKKIEELKRMK